MSLIQALTQHSDYAGLNSVSLIKMRVKINEVLIFYFHSYLGS